MRQHPYFDLLLHDDDELDVLLGAEIAGRTMLHQWPLSCVERLDLTDGRTYAYKSQRPPTVEGEFYENARSVLVPRARTLYQGGEYLCLVIDWVEAPRVEDLDVSADDALRLGRELSLGIQRIQGHLPSVLDISSEAKWACAVSDTAEEWGDLIRGGQFELTDLAGVQRVQEAAQSGPVLSAIRESPGYVHGDLTGDNVFIGQDGPRVIDWQRPILGPTDLHLVALLHSLGHDPSTSLAPGLVWVQYFLWARWLIRCQSRWFPAGKSYDRQVRDWAARMAELEMGR